MKKCLIVDSYGFLFRAYHVQPPLISPRGEPVGAIYGFTSMLIKLLSEHNPSHIVAVFDTGVKNFRHEIYPEYKSHRPDVDEDLIKQFPISRIVADKLGIPRMEADGYEADDVIATLAKTISNEGYEVIVVSSDKDLAQLMNDKIKIFDPVKATYITEEIILEKFGIHPSKIQDYLAIVGDKSDNIPGVPGFGPKTAAELLNSFDDLEGIINNVDKIKSPRKKEIFIENIEKARLSYKLAELKEDAPIEYKKDNIKWLKPSQEDVTEFLNEYGFKSLLSRAKKITSNTQMDFGLLSPEKEGISSDEVEKIDLNKVINIAYVNGYISILKLKDEIYVESNGNISSTKNMDELHDILKDDSVRKILYNIKDFKNYNAEIVSFDDISIMAYILSAGTKQMDITSLYIKYLNKNISNEKSLVSLMKELHRKLQQEIFNQKNQFLYDSVDLPLATILRNIEKIGVKFDVSALKKLSDEFEGKISNLESKIFTLSGKEFNIASPKQLGIILFEELGLPSGKKGKSGSLSTGADILENLQDEGYEIASKLLEWRHYTKLKNTYTDSLPKLVNQETSRVHTTLLQTSTATGRLSSHDPNLQNIPIRSTEGSRIRSTLICEDGYKLISADYSQIELRILAEIADIKELKKAFENDQDIHLKTACQIFDKQPDDIDKDMRRKAKAINFGIIYGISAFGLAKQLSITNIQAKEYIEKYFEAFPGIEKYMDNIKTSAEKNGFVKNYLGRKCYLPLINSSNYNERGFTQRAAINAPLQGAASDIAKIAMIKVDDYLKKSGSKTRMILQIHDELLFESPAWEATNIANEIKRIMQSVANFDAKLKVDINISDNWG